MNIMYDDTVFVAENVNNLQTLLDIVNEASCQTGININIIKTKWIVAGKLCTETVALTIDEHILETVDSFKYLGR